MRRAATALLAALLVPATTSAATAEQVCLAGLVGHAPPPVGAFIRRDQACMVWGGDEPIGPKLAHAATTPKRIRDLNCDRLAKDEAALRRTYAHDRAAIAALDRSDGQLCG